MTPRLTVIVYTISITSKQKGDQTEVEREREAKKHLVLFTLGPSREFSQHQELINEPLNEKEEGRREKKHISPQHQPPNTIPNQ